MASRIVTPVENEKLLKFSKELTQNPDIVLDYLDHGDYGEPRRCIYNVENYIKENGGEKVTGWLITKHIDTHIYYEAIFHYVVRLQDDSLKCVTPRTGDTVNKYCFVIDDSHEMTIDGDEYTRPRNRVAECKSPQEIFYNLNDENTLPQTSSHLSLDEKDSMVTHRIEW
ncbi:hypothetical protein LCGC14_2102550, partial [marine sediment metagenome]